MGRDSSTAAAAAAAAMINASSLALLNSGSVHMRGVVVAISIGRLSNGTLVVDPDEEEEEEEEESLGGGGGGGGCFAFMFTGHPFSNNNDDDDPTTTTTTTHPSDCVWSNWKSISGVHDQNEFFSARELARTTAFDVYRTMKKSIQALGAPIPYHNSHLTSSTPTTLSKVTKNEAMMMIDDEGDDDKMSI